MIYFFIFDFSQGFFKVFVSKVFFCSRGFFLNLFFKGFFPWVFPLEFFSSEVFQVFHTCCLKIVFFFCKGFCFFRKVFFFFCKGVRCFFAEGVVLFFRKVFFFAMGFVFLCMKHRVCFFCKVFFCQGFCALSLQGLVFFATGCVCYTNNSTATAAKHRSRYRVN